jgi:multidrug efflux system membrane fusion protein
MSTDWARARSTWRGLWVAVIVVGALAAAVWHRARPISGQNDGAPRAVPVAVASAETQDVPIFLSAPGTVQAWNTVSVRSQIDGKLWAVDFVEGQEVRQGDVLAEIDSRALKASLDQAIAKKAQDQAQLAMAQKDLDRDQVLLQRQAIPQQQFDQQQAQVDQLKATVSADQAAIDGAAVQLSYATIAAPIGGRTGIRQVDLGNIIHANDTNPLTILTLVKPAAVIFSLPQSKLSDAHEAMLRGPLRTTALDQDGAKTLAQGEVLLIDNQIDQNTSTMRLKARFANNDERLWPGEFVRVRAQVDTRRNAVTIPSPALQRGPQGFYVWVVQPTNTAEPRDVDAMPVDENLTIVTKGLSPGDRVVVDGQSRLESGAPVAPRSQQAAATPGQVP